MISRRLNELQRNCLLVQPFLRICGDRQNVPIFAELVAKVLADEIGWLNPHFIPDDPLEILFFCPRGDGGESLAIFLKIEKKLGHDVGREWNHAQTFGEFIDRLLAS